MAARTEMHLVHRTNARSGVDGPTRQSYGGGMNRIWTWLLIVAATLTVLCPVGAANAGTVCGATETAAQGPRDCADHEKMAPDATSCTPLCLALAQPAGQAGPAPVTRDPPMPGIPLALASSSQGPEPPPPRS